ncbi:hemocyte protein-glutamine gamma-glutamyltransferase-like [Dreissena polymorpha]|uniref:Transglutaminase-like domain-containing protein n=1 Tax=Dreissena polymorpha TaxID=45954 RepID=A0A9D4DXB5_DREPO|nr:hemocyte protein-glutamine gamma-glutamyltransferase-like [Dreissena polymorpha]KAH3768656.1 hypothetical protein DPMN_169876 [Dreissena polymorpha]
MGRRNLNNRRVRRSRGSRSCGLTWSINMELSALGRRFVSVNGNRPFWLSGGSDDSDFEQDTDETAPDKSAPEVLSVAAVNLDIRSNVQRHHTAEFDITDAAVYDEREFLVARRGQPFTVIITFNRKYDPGADDLRFVFQFGSRPLPTKGTHVEFILSADDVKGEWGGWISGEADNALTVEITTPPTAFVGKWSMKIDVVKRSDTSINVYRYEHKDPIYILFNPWCKEDGVFMKDEHLLNEYILNETGKIYSGSHKRISPKPWVFGQFTGDVLDCCLYLLDKNVKDQARGDPVVVSRAISKQVNCPDDDGVLEGNWSGKYTGGTSPLDWTGSVAILEQFYKTKTTVKFGQCWVFSGLVTTVCRALGIPARSVTNFASAHDTDGSITIDSHYDAEGNPLKEYDDDSVWNFHVWNDVWMSRPDLPTGYGGWQAIDATPQETSEGVYCMGPMSLQAIKEGNVNLPYDGPFVFAEVNADKVVWVLGKDGAMERKQVVKNSVGMFISTKRALGRASWREMLHGDPDREDVTNQYKFEEGSEEERAAIRQASKFSKRTDVYETTAEDVKLSVVSDPDTFMGNDIKLTVTLENTGQERRTCNGTLVLGSMYYTGVFHRELLSRKIIAVELVPGQTKSMEYIVPATQYLDDLADHCLCKISCVCIVQETRQHCVIQDELRLRKPHLNIKVPDAVKVGDSFSVEVSFENPLPVTLTQCELRVEGPGIQKPVVYKQNNIDVKKTFLGTFKMTPVKVGAKEIVVYFNCRQISAITTSHPVTVA